MADSKILLADMPLKHLMRLFEAETPLHVVALGDTLHPSSGYVEEAIVSAVATVGQLLDHPYNFDGLVFFEAVILVPQVLITYQAQRYQLTSDTKFLTCLVQRTRELNAAIGGPRFIILAPH
jgi:hypothetical protein